jgi:hypothetical protein
MRDKFIEHLIDDKLYWTKWLDCLIQLLIFFLD